MIRAAGYSLRMAHIARAKDRSLYNDAVLAADFAQLVIERAQIDGKFDLVEHSGLVFQAYQDQINGQLGFYGLTQDQLDRLFRRSSRCPRVSCSDFSGCR